MVQFQNGDLYRYEGVPSETFVAVITNQKSSGKAFIEMVKNRAFAFTKVKPDEVVGL